MTAVGYAPVNSPPVYLSEEQIRLRVNSQINTFFRKSVVCEHTDPDRCNHMNPSNEVLKKRIISILITKDVTDINFSTEFARAHAGALPMNEYRFSSTSSSKKYLIISAISIAAIIISTAVILGGYRVISSKI